jgi:hypothetical protein
MHRDLPSGTVVSALKRTIRRNKKKMIEEIDIEKLLSERGEYVKDAVDRWFEKIPKEELDKPVIASIGQEIEPRIYTPKDLYKELKKETKERKVSKEKEGIVVEIIKMYGEVEK